MLRPKSFGAARHNISEALDWLIVFEAHFINDKEFVKTIDDMKYHLANHSIIWLAGHFDNAFVKRINAVPRDTIDKVDFRVLAIDPKGNKSNRAALDKMVDLGVKVKLHPDLHARMFLRYNKTDHHTTDHRGLIVGSYDYNKDGLSGVKENIGIRTNSPELVDQAMDIYQRWWREANDYPIPTGGGQ